MQRATLSLLAILAILMATTPAAAQEVETLESTVITSGRLEMQGTLERNFFYFSGEVEVRGTNLQIRCDDLTVVALREGSASATIGTIGAVEEIVAKGNVEIHQAGRSAYAGMAEVDPRKGTVTLSDQPRIIDGEVEVEGYQFVLHKGEKRFESVPDPNAPEGAPSRSVVRLGAMPDLGFAQDEADITVDDRLQTGSEGEDPESEGANLSPDLPTNDDPKEAADGINN
jgi:lipopolysaccharide export system protein LptA